MKNILNQGKAIWFAFYLPNNTAWNNFYNFWNNQSENALWNPDTYCGKIRNSGDGGHAVTLAGYDDSDADMANHYWIVLNSWGTTTNRPKGIFRVKMYANYGCTFSRLSAYALGFQILNIAWAGSASGDNTAPTVTAFTIPASSTFLTVTISVAGTTDLIISVVSNRATTITASSRSFSITDTTKNQGTASSVASTTKHSLSTTRSKTSSSVLLSGTRSVAALAAGGTSSGSVTVKVPGGITVFFWAFSSAPPLVMKRNCSIWLSSSKTQDHGLV
ncbi:MAG TPA: hypothetical protein DCR81_05075 [Smithella sp.]|nr:hypothetical protein [Smithella sp.]